MFQHLNKFTFCINIEKRENINSHGINQQQTKKTAHKSTPDRGIGQHSNNAAHDGPHGQIWNEQPGGHLVVVSI